MKCPACNSMLEVISSKSEPQEVTDYFQCDLCGRNWRYTAYITPAAPGMVSTLEHSEMVEIDANEIEL